MINKKLTPKESAKLDFERLAGENVDCQAEVEKGLELRALERFLDSMPDSFDYFLGSPSISDVRRSWPISSNAWCEAMTKLAVAHLCLEMATFELRLTFVPTKNRTEFPDGFEELGDIEWYLWVQNHWKQFYSLQEACCYADKNNIGPMDGESFRNDF